MTLQDAGKIFINALLAGLFIGIAGTVFLSVPYPLAGAFLFAFGLMTILCFGFKLYTGAIGYLMTKKKEEFPSYMLTLLLIWLGNFGGCFAVGTLVRSTRSFAGIAERVGGICDAKLADGSLSLLILSFFCGILMYTGVEAFNRKEWNAIFRCAAVFLCVAIFILCGFEHCIANMYYFSAADKWSVHTLCVVVMMTIGNSLGGWLIPLADKIRK